MIDQPSHNEQELLQEIARGNTDAFRTLMRMYKDSVFSAAIGLLKDRGRAEDSVQDIFLKIWLRRTSLSSIENFGAWMHTVTRNTLLSAFKRLAREQCRPMNDGMDIPANERTVEDLLTQKEHSHLFKAAILTLSERQQQVYRLVKDDGLNREQAALQLGISLDTVKFHLSAATRKLRAYMLEHGDIAFIIMLVVKKY